jgi:hypothetical protein
MAWNGQIASPYWDPRAAKQKQDSNFDFLNANHISSGTITTGSLSSLSSIDTKQFNASTIYASNIYGYNAWLPYISCINAIANVLTLNPGTALTGDNGNLYVNGVLVTTPSNISSIDQWAKYPAINDVNVAWSSIKNVNNLWASNVISCNVSCITLEASSIRALYGFFDTLEACNANIDFLSNRFMGGQTILASTITNSGTISTSNLLAQTMTVTQGNAVTFCNVRQFTQLLEASTIQNVKMLRAKDGYFSTITANELNISSLHVNELNASTINVSSIYGSNGFFDKLSVSSLTVSSIQGGNATLNELNASTINVSSIYGSNGFFDKLSVSSLTVSSILGGNATLNNLNTQNITNEAAFITQTATVNGFTTLNGGFITNNNSYLNGTIGLNADINAGTNTSSVYGTQYLHSIRDIADFNCKSLTVNGGWTGDDFFPPYHYNTEVDIGTALISPAEVLISGENPDPLNVPTNFTTALTVRGDMAVDFGVLTCYNGANFYPFSPGGSAISIYGVADFYGLANLLGNLFVGGTGECAGAFVIGGNLNVAGIFTSTGGSVFTGGVLVTGDVTVEAGNTSFTGGTFVNYGGTVLSNGMTLYGNGTAANDFTVQGNLYINGTTSISTIQAEEVFVDSSGASLVKFGDGTGSNVLVGAIGRPDGLSNIVALVGTCNIAIQAPNVVSIAAPSIVLDGEINYLYGVTGILGTLVMNENTIENATELSYTDTITSYLYPTYVGGQIQHWNPVGGYYDFYYSQLYYTDLANAAQDGIDGYSNHRAIAQDWSYYKCENINLDMDGKYIINSGGVGASVLTAGSAIGGGSGYVDAGLMFQALTGDDYWWGLIRPSLGASPPGSEGVYVLKRLTSDGSETARGRIYDNAIYTPFANVTGNILLDTHVIVFQDQTTSVNYQIFFNNNTLYYDSYDSPTGGVPLLSEWSLYPAQHFVDMVNNDIRNGAEITGNDLVANSNFTYSNVKQPIIQCGNGNTGSSGTTITLPFAYATSNYQVQLTYHNHPAGNKPLYHNSVTASNFFVDGDNSAAFDWTTFFVP